MNCPHCAGSINPEVVARIIDQQRTVMTLQAEDGGPLTARAVGAAISGTAAIDRACAREIGVKVSTAVERIETRDDGSIVITFLTARVSE